MACERDGRGHRLRGEREPGVVHDLEPRAGPDRACPDRSLAERVEQGSHTRACILGARREDGELAMLGRLLTPRHRRVDERDVGPLLRHKARDALDPGNADRAHLNPDRSRRERREHALSAGKEVVAGGQSFATQAGRCQVDQTIESRETKLLIQARVLR